MHWYEVECQDKTGKGYKGLYSASSAMGAFAWLGRDHGIPIDEMIAPTFVKLNSSESDYPIDRES